MVMPEKSLSVAMNARTIGSGSETLVLAHGYGGDQFMWDKVVPHLVNKYKVLIFDWSFSGAVKDQGLFDNNKNTTLEAFSDDLIALLDEMNLSSTFFVGHSVSGMIGCIASIKRPELFKRLILVEASPRYINTDEYEGGFSSSDIDQLLSTIASNFNQWASFFPNIVVDGNDPPSVEYFQKSLQKMNPEIAFSVAKIIFHSDKRDVLEKVMIPCTIVQVTNDPVVPFSVAGYMEKQIKADSTVEIIDGKGHFPQLTSHLKFLEIICRVLGCDL